VFQSFYELQYSPRLLQIKEIMVTQFRWQKYPNIIAKLQEDEDPVT
jgi:hypothetical protein